MHRPAILCVHQAQRERGHSAPLSQHHNRLHPSVLAATHGRCGATDLRLGQHSVESRGSGAGTSTGQRARRVDRKLYTMHHGIGGGNLRDRSCVAQRGSVERIWYDAGGCTDQVGLRAWKGWVEFRGEAKCECGLGLFKINISYKMSFIW